ncbi:hypothetical protein MRY87_07825 [bacterium]|nr:hypothetical protein [bacterium]
MHQNRTSLVRIVSTLLILVMGGGTAALADQLHVFDPKGFLRYSGNLESERFLLVEVADMDGHPLNNAEVVLRHDETPTTLTTRAQDGRAVFDNLSGGNWQISGQGNPLKVEQVTVTASLVPAVPAAGAGSGAGAGLGGGAAGAGAAGGAAAGAGAAGGAAAGGVGAGAAAAGAGAAAAGGAAAAAGGATILGVSATAATVGAVAVAGGAVVAVEAADDNNDSPTSPFE